MPFRGGNGGVLLHNLSVYPERDIASFHACNFIFNLDELQDMLKEEITKVQRQYQPSTNSRRQQPLDFQVRQSVFIRSQYFWTTRPSKKLSEKYLRPYEIISQSSLQSFTLRLPDTIRAVHPVFHIFMLEPATTNTFQQCSEPLYHKWSLTICDGCFDTLKSSKMRS